MKTFKKRGYPRIILLSKGEKRPRLTKRLVVYNQLTLRRSK